jgi:Protein of unknown function (DUF3460)
MTAGPSTRSPPAMGMLPARHYVSDYTKFILDVLAKKPEVVADQKKGRAIFWDKTPRELAARDEMDEGRVPQKPYVYFNPL